MALQRAVQDGLICINPAVGCKLPPKTAWEMRALTKNEILRFLHQAKEENYYEFFLLELGAGMHWGEILALKWSEFNVTAGELHIERQVYVIKGRSIVSTPKTKVSGRTVILSRLLQMFWNSTSNRLIWIGYFRHRWTAVECGILPLYVNGCNWYWTGWLQKDTLLWSQALSCQAQTRIFESTLLYSGFVIGQSDFFWHSKTSVKKFMHKNFDVILIDFNSKVICWLLRSINWRFSDKQNIVFLLFDIQYASHIAQEGIVS